jgi:hypothetical protein
MTTVSSVPSCTSGLDRVCYLPRRIEIDSIELALTPERTWALLRHGDLGRSPLTHALFALRTLPSRLAGGAAQELHLRIDDLSSSTGHPGFQVLLDEAPREVVVGAIGKVWQLDIPFVHVADADAFAAFDEPGFIKVAWAIRVLPLGDTDSRVELEVRVDATDDLSWQKFRRYFLVVGPASHFIRKSLLATLVHEHGTPASKERERPLPGDDLVPDVAAQATHGVTIRARPAQIWPWLVQMGGRRAGYYSIDVLDNGGEPSAMEVHPELQDIRVGDVLPATPDSLEGFEVLRVERDAVLVLGGLYDSLAKKQLPFAARRPDAYWHVTWAFVLEPLDAERTRLHVRARVAFSPGERAHAAWIGLVHPLMERAQLRNLRARVEGTLPRDGVREVAQGLSGAAIMAASFLTPFLRRGRSHWGLDEAAAARSLPGDDLVKAPTWHWTHGVTIEESADRVWPWVAQIGADRAGFYSYQWLENLAGCDLRNAETLHPDWAIAEGGALSLHPKMPPLPIVELIPGSHFVAYGQADEVARAAGKPWVEASWLFLVEPLGERRCRFVSRYRCGCSRDLATRLQFGQGTVEPVGFAMDRRMLLGVKERVEKSARAVLAAPRRPAQGEPMLPT